MVLFLDIHTLKQPVSHRWYSSSWLPLQLLGLRGIRSHTSGMLGDMRPQLCAGDRQRSLAAGKQKDVRRAQWLPVGAGFDMGKLLLPSGRCFKESSLRLPPRLLGWLVMIVTGVKLCIDQCGIVWVTPQWNLPVAAEEHLWT